MKKAFALFTILSLIAIIISGCEEKPPCVKDEDCIPEKPLVGVKYLCVQGDCMTRPLGNPATEFCIEKGFITEMRTQANGGQYSVCKFKEGNECEEWMFFRRECTPGDISININQGMFIPEEIHIKAGTTLTWKNMDNAPHQIVNDIYKDYSTGELFNSQRLDSAEKEDGVHDYSYTFDRAGEYKYHCQINPSMKGKIIVS